MVSEVLIELGSPENRLMLPVTILDSMEPFTLKFGSKSYRIGFDKAGCLGVTYKGKTKSVTSHGRYVVRQGTDVVWK